MSDMKTCFKRVDYDLSSLLHYLDIGDIGLPDIQRPFVWSNAKVRDWFDSMHHGFPVGYFPFWENAQTNGIKRVGIDAKAHSTPSRSTPSPLLKIPSSPDYSLSKIILNSFIQYPRGIGLLML
jgi:hypothetical protein